MALREETSLYISIGYYLLVPGLLVLNWALFRYLLGMDYFTWYLTNGALIAIGTAFVSRIWESIEELSRPLISADPIAYYGTCLQITGIMTFVFGNSIVSPAPSNRQVGIERFRLDVVMRQLDLLLNALVLSGAFVVTLGWLLFVAPANYLVTLISGAPARQHRRHPDKRIIGVVGRILPDREKVAAAHVGRFRNLYLYETGTIDSPKLTTAEEKLLGGAKGENGLYDLTFGRNPFGSTQMITGFVLFVVGRFV